MSYKEYTNIANRKNYGSKRSLTSIEYIVIHYTANDGDCDENNGKYFHNNVVYDSAHDFVDSNSVTHSVPYDYVAYSVGGIYKKDKHGGKYYQKCTNYNSVSVELCDDLKNGSIYPTKATIDNAIALTVSLCKKFNVNPKTNVIRHYEVNYKNCLPVEETELLTPNGWKLLKDITKDDEIATYYENGDMIYFEKPLDVVEIHKDTVIDDGAYIATKDHRMWCKSTSHGGNGRFKFINYGSFFECHRQYAFRAGGNIYTNGIDISDDMLRLLVWVQADGHYGECKSNLIDFHFSKARKIERVKEILDRLGIEYYYHKNKDNTVRIKISDIKIKEELERFLDNKKFTYKLMMMSQRQFEIFKEELVQADGNVEMQAYFSTIKQNYDVVQGIFALHNTRNQYTTIGSSDCVCFGYRTMQSCGRETRINKRKTYETYVGCVTVKSGKILVRQRGRTYVTGNCPQYWLDDSKWKKEFLNKVISEYSKSQPSKITKVVNTVKSAVKKVLKKNTIPTPPFEVYVKIKDLNVRELPNMNGKIIKTVGEQTVKIDKVQNGWGRIYKSGWIYLENSNYCNIGKKLTQADLQGTKKSINEIAKEVINGKWGNGEERKKKLEKAGYNYKEVQKAVNKLFK